MSFSEQNCDAPPTQKRGHYDVCPTPYKYQSKCSYECDPGYELPSSNIHEIECIVKAGPPSTVKWNNDPSDCIGELLDSSAHQ